MVLCFVYFDADTQQNDIHRKTPSNYKECDMCLAQQKPDFKLSCTIKLFPAVLCSVSQLSGKMREKIIIDLKIQELLPSPDKKILNQVSLFLVLCRMSCLFVFVLSVVMLNAVAPLSSAYQIFSCFSLILDNKIPDTVST